MPPKRKCSCSKHSEYSNTENPKIYYIKHRKFAKSVIDTLIHEGGLTQRSSFLCTDCAHYAYNKWQKASPQNTPPASPSKQLKNQEANNVKIKDNARSAATASDPVQSQTPTKLSLRLSDQRSTKLSPGSVQTRASNSNTSLEDDKASGKPGGQKSGASPRKDAASQKTRRREESNVAADSLIQSERSNQISSISSEERKNMPDKSVSKNENKLTGSVADLARPQRSSGRIRTPTVKAAESQINVKKKPRNRILSPNNLGSGPSKNQSGSPRGSHSGDDVGKEVERTAKTATAVFQTEADGPFSPVPGSRSVTDPNDSSSVQDCASSTSVTSPVDSSSVMYLNSSVVDSVQDPHSNIPAMDPSPSIVMDHPGSISVMDPNNSSVEDHEPGSSLHPDISSIMDHSGISSVKESSDGDSEDFSDATSPVKSPGSQKTARMFIVPKSSDSALVGDSFDSFSPKGSTRDAASSISSMPTSNLAMSVPRKVGDVLIREFVVMPEDVMLSLKVKGSEGHDRVRSQRHSLVSTAVQVEDDLMGSDVLYIHPNDEAPVTEIASAVNLEAVVSSTDIEDKVLGGVSALIKDSILEIEGMRQFITTELPSFTYITCFKTADKIAISGTFQAVARTWSILTNIEHHINEQSQFSGKNVQIELVMKNGDKKTVTFKRGKVKTSKPKKTLEPVTVLVDMKEVVVASADIPSQSADGDDLQTSISHGNSPQKHVSLLSGKSFTLMSSMEVPSSQEDVDVSQPMLGKGKQRGRPRKILQGNNPGSEDAGDGTETEVGDGNVGNNVVSQMDDDNGGDDDYCEEEEEGDDGDGDVAHEEEGEVSVNDNGTITVSIKCDVCHQLIPREDINSHHADVHGTRIKNISPGTGNAAAARKVKKVKQSKVEVQGNEFPERGGAFVQCTTCSQRFRCWLELSKHQRRAHSFLNLISESSRRSLRFNCNVCGKKFNEKRYLSAHLKRHVGIKKHTCATCGWRFYEAHKLKFHMETHKRQEDRHLPYRCGVCQRQYHNRQSWNDHMNTHDGAKPYKCTKCTSSFAHRIGLHRHRLTHEKESPYTCSYCSRGFKTRSNLTSHLTVHTRISRHVCDRCGKVFTVGTSLRRHRCMPEDRVVQKYMCGVCNMTFPTLILAESHSFQHVDNSSVNMNLVGIQVEEVEAGTWELAPESGAISQPDAEIEKTFIVDTNGDVIGAQDISVLINSAAKMAESDGNVADSGEAVVADEEEKIHIAASTLADLSTLSQDGDVVAREQAAAIVMVTTAQEREFHQEQIDTEAKYLATVPSSQSETVLENSYVATQSYVDA